MLTHLRGTCLFCLAFFSYGSTLTLTAADPQPRWWKGNLHTHSLWSDGDEFPEMIAAWYAERDYNFLALSDHNVLSRGPRYMPLEAIIKRSDDKVLERYQNKFGSNWVETRSTKEDGKIEVRLKPLDEFRRLLEQAGKFIMIEGEEISDKAEGKPVHMNATNLSEVIQPVGGATVQEVMQNNLRLVLEHEKASGRQVLPHLNHPNFGYAIVAADIAKTVEERFFEVYNGHPGVNQLGDKTHQSIEEMWDVANAMRLAWLDADPIYGIATDDSHEYHGKPGSRPGRGWVMVRAPFLTPEYLIRAMKAGDFYASSGVVLDDIRFNSQTRTLEINIASVGNAAYETKFVTLPRPRKQSDSKSPAASGSGKPTSGEANPVDLPVARVSTTATGLSVSYTLKDDEAYVRAIITSNVDHVDPSLKDQKQQAWTQPVGWK